MRKSKNKPRTNKELKKGRTHIQVWLWDDGRYDDHAKALWIWSHYRNDMRFRHQKNQIIVKALIALWEKENQGYEVVPDRTPAIMSQLSKMVTTISGIADRLQNVQITTAGAQHQIQAITEDLTQTVSDIDFDITSDTQEFSEDDE